MSLRQADADRDWSSADAGGHYHELAHWLRGIAAKCRLPYSQRELLDLAQRYDARADRLSRGAKDRYLIPGQRFLTRVCQPVATIRACPSAPRLLGRSDMVVFFA